MADIFGDDNSEKKDDFGALLEASFDQLKVTFSKGDKVRGEVLTIGKEEVFVSVAGKDGSVHKTELLKDGVLTVQVGDILDLFVIRQQEGLLQLTVKPSSKALAETLEDAFDFETPVEGRVTEAVNGGFRVLIQGKTAFCPTSQMDSKPITNPEDYFNKKFEFIITKFEQKGRNIVCSRRKVLDMEALENQGAFLEKTKVGSEVTGQVVRMEAFGAFIQIAPGLEGLLHISEIGWSRIAHPSEALQMGETLTAKVIKLEEDATGRLRISLSRKQASDDPFLKAAESHKVGQILKGTIRKIERFGFLIELAPGFVGLLPRSAMKEVSTEENLDKKVPGDTLEVKINEINLADKRISLGLASGSDDQSWKEFSSADQKGFNALGDQLKGFFDQKPRK